MILPKLLNFAIVVKAYCVTSTEDVDLLVMVLMQLLLMKHSKTLTGVSIYLWCNVIMITSPRQALF